LDRQRRTRRLHIGSQRSAFPATLVFRFLNLDDRMAQIRLTEGTLNLRVRRLDRMNLSKSIPPTLLSRSPSGNYKINVNEAAIPLSFVVRDGEGEVTGGGSAYTVHPRETGTFTGTDQLDADIQRFGMTMTTSTTGAVTATAAKIARNPRATSLPM